MAIDFRLRDFTHPLLIARLRRAFERTQWLPPEDIAAEQSRLLRATVRHAYRAVPFYRRALDESGIRPDEVRGIDDLAGLPLLTRDIVQCEGASLRANGPRATAYRTSGTTGQPLTFMLDARSNALEFVYYWRHWSWAGYQLGDTFAELGANHFLRRKRLTDATVAWQPHLRRLMLNSARVSAANAGEMIASIDRYRPRFIKGMASTLFFFARCLEEVGVGALPFKAAFSTGEKLTSGFRETISSILGCPVLDSYGHIERTVAISQCMELGYHVNSDYGALELVEPRPEADGTTVARVVGTSLHNSAMPLIRYDVGDEVELLDKPHTCRCGRQLPLVKGVRGRTDDVIVTPDGRYVTGIFVVAEFVNGVGLAQFEQIASDEIEIRVVPRQGWTGAEAMALLGHARNMLGSGVRVRLREVTPADIATDASGKRRAVISARPAT